MILGARRWKVSASSDRRASTGSPRDSFSALTGVTKQIATASQVTRETGCRNLTFSVLLEHAGSFGRGTVQRSHGAAPNGNIVLIDPVYACRMPVAALEADQITKI